MRTPYPGIGCYVGIASKVRAQSARLQRPGGHHLPRRGARVSLGAVASLSWLSRPAFARVAPFALFIAFIAAQSIVGDSPALVVARGVAVAAPVRFRRRSG